MCTALLIPGLPRMVWGKRVKLWDLLLKAGIKEEEAKLLRFTVWMDLQ